MALIKEVACYQDVKVQIVNTAPDLYVYITNKRHEAKGRDAIWYVDHLYADYKVKFVKNFADLKIQYVTLKSMAGWKNKSHELRNRLK
ncbi:hypothetical protein NA63_2591 [Flavobacteriaceae bacterium MAR_2010_105]|nr:hypothetical protein NA63_2591 [Flavobacteriaceae bacterium MAR_2010_105]